MQAHPIETWIKIIAQLPSPASETAEQTIANRILGDLVGYRYQSRHRLRDRDEIANAMVAYARMIQEFNLKV